MQSRISRDPNGHFLSIRTEPTGSSARQIKRTGVDMLAGRALLRELHPFLPAELGDLFDLEGAMEHGLVPLVVASANPTDVLRSYAALYVQEEVKTEGLVRNIGSFSRSLEAVCFSHGAVLSISNVARECEVKPKTVSGYISILEDLLLAFRLPASYRNKLDYIPASRLIGPAPIR